MGLTMNNIIIPFTLSPLSHNFKGIYPTPEEIKDVFTNANETERYGIIRLWITEGIPYAFKDEPLIYEEVREFIAKCINVHSKEVTLVGSGRIGYSLKKKVWGKSFTNSSDLDFTIISNNLFSKLVIDFQKWVGEVESKKIKPRTPNELRAWLGSIEVIDRNIPRGFIYTKNLLPYKIYPTARKCYNTMNILQERLSKTKDAPQISDASIRVYSDWKSCIRQLSVNFKTALDLW
jgi:hypothetical protein